MCVEYERFYVLHTVQGNMYHGLNLNLLTQSSHFDYRFKTHKLYKTILKKS